MKLIVVFLLIANISICWAARLGGEDDPTPFPQSQSPRDLVGHWLGSQPGEELTVKFLPAKKDENERLFVSIFTFGRKIGQGYLYDSENQMFCGYIHHSGPAYTLCIWKENKKLKSQTLEKNGEWRESLWTH